MNKADCVINGIRKKIEKLLYATFATSLNDVDKWRKIAQH